MNGSFYYHLPISSLPKLSKVLILRPLLLFDGAVLVPRKQSSLFFELVCDGLPPPLLVLQAIVSGLQLFLQSCLPRNVLS